MIIKRIRVLTIISVFLALAGASGGFALEVTGIAPQFGGGDVVWNSDFSSAWDSVLNDINDEIGDIDSKPEKLIKAWGDASIFASQGATQRGYGEPKLFTFTVGSMVGIKTGTSLSNIRNYIDSVGDKIEDEGDIVLGANIQAISGQFNFNTSRFLLNGLDLGIRFGYFKMNHFSDDFGLNTWSFGLVGGYQMLKEKTIVPVVLKWRGLSLGTGFIYQHSNIYYSVALDSINQDIEGVYSGTIINIEPKLVFDMTTNTFTIPLELTTAIQLLSFLNITLGLGADLGFGKNKMTLDLSGDINLRNLPTGISQTRSGNVTVSGGGTMAPSFFNPKIMTGIGFKIGPVILDVPVSLYLMGGDGFSVGVTFGVIL
ncbi:Lsa36 family surface (lipo)protein [Leadbettera azotonutricia]|uniref:DUF5723 domain-containing protein n=1 Tax=Leadbettera azotonutricia (strain ATCC BAA-888 / DSM 13862 / ZAS-9) TaxID=545695 RepID=F5Y9G8_LEAAZ|nr:hypothetical protein [Leadbettera azotonutricia]AEF80095.1 hypothetical protein TREAZ_2093 [Leadbettera azotonutricia ZAS-9]